MPLHLNSKFTRRGFLGGTAASLVPFQGSLFAEESDSQVWAFLSDTHIAADPAEEARGINMASHLEKVVASLLTEAGTLSGVIIDGDCALNEGLAGDYETFASLISPLVQSGLPVHMTLGNHDDRVPFRETFSDHTSPPPIMPKKHVSFLETPLANWILLDSLRYVNKTEGEFGRKQLKWVAKILDENPDKPAILVGHHYPQIFREDVIPGDKPVKVSGLVDSEAFLDLIQERKQAKAYIFGHSHFWKVETTDAGIHQVNLPPTAYVFDPVHPSGWVRATIGSDRLDLELISLDPTHEQHGEKHSLAWR